MNASHASHPGPAHLHPARPRPAHRLRTTLLVMYAALAAQLAIWSILAARVNLHAAFTQPHQGAEADVVTGSTIWLVLFTLAVALATINYRRYHR
jgi:hypothetical protein